MSFFILTLIILGRYQAFGPSMQGKKVSVDQYGTCDGMEAVHMLATKCVVSGIVFNYMRGPVC